MFASTFVAFVAVNINIIAFKSCGTGRRRAYPVGQFILLAHLFVFFLRNTFSALDRAHGHTGHDTALAFFTRIRITARMIIAVFTAPVSLRLTGVTIQARLGVRA